MSFDALLDADFKTEPWDHQLREFEFSADLPARGLWWQMRTGKSKFTLDTASSLYRRGKIDSVLIFAPNGVHANWTEREVPRHLWDSIDYTSLAWTTRLAGVRGGNRLSKADKEAWDDAHAMWWAKYLDAIKRHELSILSFNSESVTRPDVRKAIRGLLRRRRVLTVWDESSDYRSPGSSRSKMARSIARKSEYRRLLDGTVITNSPLHAFAQFELLEKGALGFTRNEDFKAYFAEYEEKRRRDTGRAYQVLTGYKNLDVLRDRMAPFSSVVLREDCSDLPALVPTRKVIPLSPEQTKAYKQVQTELKVEVAEGRIADLNALAVKLGKLQQVVSGWLIDKHGEAHRIAGPNPKLEALADEVFFTPGKVIVWCAFHHEMDDAAARLRRDGWEVWEYHGRISETEKARIRAEWSINDTVKAVVAHSQSMGRGVEVPADRVIWYGHTFNGIMRKQANERATVMGGSNIGLVDLVSPGIDEYILSVTDSGAELADRVAGRGLQTILNRVMIGE